MQVAYLKNESNSQTQKAFNSSIIVPTMGYVTRQANNVMVQLGPRQPIKAPDLFSQHIMNSPLAQSLPCKSINDATRCEYNVVGMINRGRYPASRPQVGNQRGDKPGLASVSIHPTNTPLFAKANSFYSSMPSKLGKK